MMDMVASAAGSMWGRAAAGVAAATGWWLEPQGRLGQSREDRATWLAEGPSGPVVVKVVPAGFVADRAKWAAVALPALARRGYPVAEFAWQGPLDDQWFLVVQPKLPGRPLDSLGPTVLKQLLSLVELQAGVPGVEGGWDISWWVSVILFEGWEGWWRTAWQVAPQETAGLRALLEPAWGYRLPVGDVVHHDLGRDNVLVVDGTISGVVDWDDAGIGSRAVDLAGLLFEWQHVQATGQEAVPGGGALIARRLLDVAGDRGLRCAIAYAAVDRIAHSAKGGTAAVCTWRQVTGSVLATLASIGVTS